MDCHDFLMKILFFYFIFCTLVFGDFTLASEKITSSNKMNGYKLSDYTQFEKNWKLITVRYRKDTGEMRFTYANDLAFEALQKGQLDYPDGSVFAKIGLKTQEDPGFPSSAVPSGARRYQFMVRDKKKHSKTDGWGYALFDRDGFVFPEPLETQTAACAACHHIIPERGYVFSQMMSLSPGTSPDLKIENNNYFNKKIEFSTTSIQSLPTDVSKFFPKENKTIRKINHPISQFLFQGSLDEIKPTLIKEAILSKMPALIISPDLKSFALAYVENFDLKCEMNGHNGFFVKTVSMSSIQKNQTNENRFCWAD